MDAETVNTIGTYATMAGCFLGLIGCGYLAYREGYRVSRGCINSGMRDPEEIEGKVNALTGYLPEDPSPFGSALHPLVTRGYRRALAEAGIKV